MSLQQGLAIEQKAKRFLQEQGFIFITQNYRCRFGEIDLIMQDKTHLVFVEVRARARDVFGKAVETITLQKQEKIRKTALHYWTYHPRLHYLSLRFDVVFTKGIEGPFNLIENAF